MTESVGAWVAPTGRSMAWRPLGCTAAVLACAIVAASVAGSPPADGTVAIVAVTALIAAAVLALDDPAFELLASVPVGVGRRVARRVTLVVPATVVAAVALGCLGRTVGVLADPASVLAPGAALGAVALAVHLAVVGRWPAGAATVASATPAGWVVLGLAAGGTGWFATVTNAWRDHPGVVTLAAAAWAAVASGPRRM